MERTKLRKRIGRIYAVLAVALLAAVVVTGGVLIYTAFFPNGNSAGAVLAELVAVLVVIIFGLGGAILELMLYEVFVLVRYLLTEPQKKTVYTVCNVASASAAVLIPVTVLLLNVLELDRNGTLSLWLLLSWGGLWACFRAIYGLFRLRERQKS